MRGFVHALCDALSSHDANRVAPWLHDDVEWTLFGPVDLFPFAGQRRGKAAVLAGLRQMSSSLHLQKCGKESLLTEGDNMAVLMRLNLLQTRTNRSIILRLAQFTTFREGKLIAMRGLFDSFDAVEQALGRHIDLSAVA
jgi:ketosteroid isomerase-like protein